MIFLGDVLSVLVTANEINLFRMFPTGENDLCQLEDNFEIQFNIILCKTYLYFMLLLWKFRLTESKLGQGAF